MFHSFQQKVKAKLDKGKCNNAANILEVFVV